MDEINRRHAIKIIAALVGAACLPSCCLLTGRNSNCANYKFDHITNPVIDMHGHFFNATDLLVVDYIMGPALNDFVGDSFKAVRELLKRIAKAIVELIKAFRPNISAKSELKWLSSDQACSPSDEYDTISSEFHTYMTAEDSHKSMQLSAADSDLKNLPFQTVLNRAAEEFDSLMQKNNQLMSPVRPNIEFRPDTLKQAVLMNQSSQKNMQGIEAVPGCPGDSNAVFRVLAFVARALAKRSTNVQAYYDTYSQNPIDGYGVRHVMNISCDFDFFLGCENEIRSPLAEQIAVHEKIYQHTNGYAIPVLGVNPWKMSHDKEYVTLINNTLARGIYKGVKLYPSIGYTATGEFPDKLRHRTCDGHDISEDRMKKGMETLISIVAEHKAYITSHTTYSKGAEPGYERFSSAKYWIEHLRKRPDLRVNFGHMGDPGSKGDSKWREGFLSLMRDYENVYGDFGYHDYDNYDVLKHDLTSFQDNYSVSILKKITYGSDWYMISKDKGSNAYLCSASRNFEKAVSDGMIKNEHLRDMFYNNAARFLNL
jgi:hypothetical protein